MRRIIQATLAIICLLPAGLRAQENRMSLNDCIDYALAHQAKMKNAILDKKTSLAKNKEVTGLALPQLKATGSINYAPLVAAFQVPNFIKYGVTGVVKDDAIDPTKLANTPDNLSFAFQPKWTTTTQLEASQILFDPGVMVALQARKKLEELARKNVDLTEEQVRVAVMKAYYNILIADKRMALVNQNVERISQLERETRAIYENGLAEKTDVDRITISLTNLQTEQTRTKQLVDITYLALKFQMGMPLDEGIALTDTLSEDYIDREILTHPFNVENRKEYQLLQIQSKVYGYDVKRYKLGVLPTINLFANYGYTLYDMNKLFNPEDNWQKSALIGGKLSLPLFDGMQRRNKLAQSKYALQKVQNDMENTRYALELEKENARVTFQANISSLANQKKNMNLATEVYNRAKIKYQEGVGSNLEVMDAESALKEAQTNYFTVLFDAINSRIDLQKALGELQ